jgi:hypothetical protein
MKLAVKSVLGRTIIVLNLSFYRQGLSPPQAQPKTIRVLIELDMSFQIANLYPSKLLQAALIELNDVAVRAPVSVNENYGIFGSYYWFKRHSNTPISDDIWV